MTTTNKEEITLNELAGTIIHLEFEEGMSYDEIFNFVKEKYKIPFDDKRLECFINEVLDEE